MCICIYRTCRAAGERHRSTKERFVGSAHTQGHKQAGRHGGGRVEVVCSVSPWHTRGLCYRPCRSSRKFAIPTKKHTTVYTVQIYSMLVQIRASRRDSNQRRNI